MLRLLIDTSAWLDLAQRRDGQNWIVPLRVFMHQDKLELLVPGLVIEEFERNRPRLEAAVTRSVVDRLRQLRKDLHEFAGDQHARIWLAETRQHIPLVNTMAPQNFREIAELLARGKTVRPTNAERARVVRRGLEKRAPFTSDKNSVADALLIEMYATQLKYAGPEDVYCFVTSNYRDFSAPDGDHRQPHPDLADLFSTSQSQFLYQVDGLHTALLDYFGDEFIQEYEELQFIVDAEEPRTLAEIAEAEAEFFDKVAYVRFVVRADRESGKYPEEIREEKFQEMLASRADVEAKYGREELWKPIGPGRDEAWRYGYISGKLATLRWVLGSEWDFLDT
ncbi:MAG TPA: PIN domain-containing protein [Ktedonobacterales bacterium]|nr:PIN domain-containing protein [Ktedonobacterales bacterium]